MRLPWTAGKSNQSILKEISPEYSLEGTLMLGKIEGRRRRGRQRMRWLDGITYSMEHEFEQAPGVDDGQGSLACCGPLGCKESDTAEQLNSTELN